MSVTRLKRKHRKNIARANNKQQEIKDLLRTPTLKNVDLEELKSRFGASTGAAPKAAAPAAAEAPKASLLEKVKGAAASVVDAVTHSDVVEKAKEAVSDAMEAVTHSDIVEKAKDAVEDVVEKVKHAVSGDDETSANAAAFDEAEAVTKPVNEDGQEGEHPKPEIAL